jgi:hypothetical protein
MATPNNVTGVIQGVKQAKNVIFSLKTPKLPFSSKEKVTF